MVLSAPAQPLSVKTCNARAGPFWNTALNFDKASSCDSIQGAQRFSEKRDPLHPFYKSFFVKHGIQLLRSLCGVIQSMTRKAPERIKLDRLILAARGDTSYSSRATQHRQRWQLSQLCPTAKKERNSRHKPESEQCEWVIQAGPFAQIHTKQPPQQPRPSVQVCLPAQRALVCVNH